MSLRVLRAGLDTVEVSFAGAFADESIEQLDRAKAYATDRDGPVPIALGALELQVMPKAFAYWSWRLVDPRFHIVGKRSAKPGQPVAQVRLSSFGLANEHSEALWFLIQTALSQLGVLLEFAVSRADVCVDIQGWTPTPEDMDNVVTRVSYRATHGTDKQVQTFHFGKKTVLRVYNKSEELKASKKTWLRELWGQSEGYDPAQDVWRIEFQASGNVLKELGIESAAQLFAQPGAILDYGLRWAQLRVPGGDATKTRWPEDPRWTAIREAAFQGVPLQRHVRPAELMTLDAAKSRLIGLVALAGAYYETTDYLDALQRLSFAAEVHMMHMGTDFAALVEDKRRRVLANDL